MAAVKPTLISYTSTTDWTSAGASGAKTTPSLSWNIGDVVTVIAADEGGASATVWTISNTGSGLSFGSPKQETIGAGIQCQTVVWQCIATATSSGTVTVNQTNSVTDHMGGAVYVHRNSNGLGLSVKQNTATQTVSFTPTGAHSAILWTAMDFNADAAYTNGVPNPPTNTRLNAQDATHYTTGLFDLDDQTSSGAVSYGKNGGGTTGPFSIVVIEVQGGNSSSVPKMSRPFPFTPGSPPSRNSPYR